MPEHCVYIFDPAATSRSYSCYLTNWKNKSEQQTISLFSTQCWINMKFNILKQKELMKQIKGGSWHENSKIAIIHNSPNTIALCTVDRERWDGSLCFGIEFESLWRCFVTMQEDLCALDSIVVVREIWLVGSHVFCVVFRVAVETIAPVIKIKKEKVNLLRLQIKGR
jgi:hypothetical protein